METRRSAMASRRILLTMFLTAGLVLVLASTGHAATVRATTGGSGAYGVSEGSVFYDAGPGEANRLTATLEPGSRGVVDVHDAGAVIVPGDRCERIDDSTTRCDAAADFVIVTATLGDMDDSATIDPLLYGIVGGDAGADTLRGGCVSTGGPGDDDLTGCTMTSPAFGYRLLGGPGDDVIRGGDAAEIIDGGGGGDVLMGGGGSDAISDGDSPLGEAGPDVIDGGPGAHDLVDYRDRIRPVHVDLVHPEQGQGSAGETDTIRGVEDVTSGTAGDTLLGDEAANRLDAGDGADLVDGRGGNDLLFDGAGRDIVRGGPGDDQIVTRDLYRDTVSCGTGADGALGDGRDTLSADCEGRTRRPVRLAPRRMGVRNGRASLRLPCHDLDELRHAVAREFETCAFRVRLTLMLGRRLIAAGQTRCGAAGCAQFVLPRAAWSTLRTHGSLAARLEFLRTPTLGAFPLVERLTVKVSRIKT